MGNLLDLLTQNNGKPFKARKVKEFRLDGIQELPVGTIIQVMEKSLKRKNCLACVVLGEDGQEDRKTIYGRSDAWIQV